MSNLIPVSRKEQYLSKIDGMTNKSPDKTYTKEEYFFSEILGEALHKPVLETRYEMYLAKIAGREIGIPYPETRLERFLAKAAGMNISVPTPITREEMYWSTYSPFYLSNASGEPPLSYNSVTGTLNNYRIYGQTSRNLFSSRIEQGSFDASTGALDGSRYRVRSHADDYIYLLPGNYELSASGVDYSVIYGYDSPDVNTFNSNLSRDRWVNLPSTITINTSAYYKFGFRRANNPAITPSDISNIMLNSGSTPLPYEPYGESVGDRTGNLFDGEFLQGYWAYANGMRDSSPATWITTSKLPCKPNTDYSFKSSYIGCYFGFVWFDSNGEYISSSYVSDTSSNMYVKFSSLSPVDAAYLIINIKSKCNTSTGDSFTITPSDVTDLMLNEGSTALPYEPYGYKVPVTVEGKNLLPNTATSRTINGVTITVNEDGSITCNGTTTNQVEIRLVTFFSLPAGNYRLTGTPSGGSTSSYFLRVWYDSGTTKVWLNDVGSGYNFTLTDTTTMYSSILIRTDKVLNHITFYPMVRKADIEDDTYEPYHEPITTSIYLPEQIRKVGDEAEYIDYGEQKLHRVGAEDIDVTLPVLPTVTGTNVLSVGTEVQPSHVFVEFYKEREYG